MWPGENENTGKGEGFFADAQITGEKYTLSVPCVNWLYVRGQPLLGLSFSSACIQAYSLQKKTGSSAVDSSRRAHLSLARSILRLAFSARRLRVGGGSDPIVQTSDVFLLSISLLYVRNLYWCLFLSAPHTDKLYCAVDLPLCI